MLKSYKFKAFNCLGDLMALIQPDSFFRCCCTNKNTLIHKECVQSTTQPEKHRTIWWKYFSEIALIARNIICPLITQPPFWNWTI
jgi:hypothetical protein